MSESKQENGGANLFSAFDPPSYEEWVETTIKSLKGKPFDKVKSNTYEGIMLEPMYRSDDIAELAHRHSLPGQYPYVRGTSPTPSPWQISQELPDATPSAANAAIKKALARGQTAVFLIFDPPTRDGLDPSQSSAGLVGRGGLSLSSMADVAMLLDGIDLTETPLFMQPETAVSPVTALFIAYFAQNNIDLATLTGCAGADPVGTLVRYGMAQPITKAYDRMAQLVRWSAEHAPNFQTVGVFVDHYHNAGANAVQELALGLATAVAYLRALQERGVAIDEAANSIRFIFGLGSNFFMEVAKLRAARMVWAQIVAAFGGSTDAQKMRMHTRTSRFNKTATDPYVNMLRATTEALAGAIGGTDSQHVGPFDETVRTPDGFSGRIARNVQIMLQDETNLTQLTDPAGGAYYVEYLTDQVAEKAWALFQAIEEAGGMLAALEAGLPQEWVTETAVARAKNLASRKDVLVGTNMYPNLGEEKLATDAIDYEAIYAERLAEQKQSTVNSQQVTSNQSDLASLIGAAKSGATLGQMWGIQPVMGIPPYSLPLFPKQRAAQPFEALRKRADDFLAEHGHRPRIFMANIGPLANHKPRADFTAGFFEVGGFELVRTAGFDSVAAAVEAMLASGETAVAICGTDSDYPDFVPPFVQQLKAAIPDAAVILAGYPKAHVEMLQAAGVDMFIHIRANCYQLNKDLQAKLIG